MTPDRDTVFAKVRSALISVLVDEDRGGDVDVHAGAHLVDELGFDSLRIASLTIALEDEFDEVLLLNDWIAAAGSPGELTVGSLVDYLVGVLAEGG